MIKNRLHLILFTLCSLFSISISAQEVEEIAGKAGKRMANISVSLPGQTFNLGLLGNIPELNGVGLNVVSGIARGNVNGVQISGLVSVAGRNMNGVQLSGLVNVNGQNMNGISLTGLFNITGEKANGVIASGMANIIGENLNGAAINALINIVGNEGDGAMLAGLCNITGEKMNGAMIAGLLNISGERSSGLMLSSLMNITGGHSYGLQLAGIGNIAIQNEGLQIGLLNITRKNSSGAQIGLANISGEGKNGFQLGVLNVTPKRTLKTVGLVNIDSDTKTQLLVYGGNMSAFNIAARFLNKFSYSILGAGTYYPELEDHFSYTFSYRTGVYHNFTDKFRLSADIGYTHIESQSNKSHEISAEMYALQGRLNAEYSFTNKFGLFVSGGYGLTRYYDKDKSYSKDTLIEIGFVLF